MSVCQSGLGGNVIFPAPIVDRALIFCVYIPLVYEHLFLSVGQATKGKRASLLWMLSSLFLKRSEIYILYKFFVAFFKIKELILHFELLLSLILWSFWDVYT